MKSVVQEPPISLTHKLKAEIKAVALATLYFGACIAVLTLLKTLILADYHIAFHGFSLALMGALIIAKVVIVLEHVPLGAWTRSRPAWIDILLRTLLYGLAVAAALVLEKAFDARHLHGGFPASLRVVFRHPDIDHVWANTLCISLSLLGYNTAAIVKRHLGANAWTRILFSPPPQE